MMEFILLQLSCVYHPHSSTGLPSYLRHQSKRDELTVVRSSNRP